MTQMILYPVYLGFLNPTYQGTTGNDTYTAHESDSFMFADRVNGNGGIDYFRTGGGNDGIDLGSNAGHWRGGANLTGQATLADGGAGNDDLGVIGEHGAFQLTTGEGKDLVFVHGGEYVEIQAADGDTARDTFRFDANFSGSAKLYGVDHGDLLDLRADHHWHRTQVHGDLAFRNDIAAYDAHGHAHHGLIEIMGVSASYHDGQPDFVV